jgi:hypothetical protein
MSVTLDSFCKTTAQPTILIGQERSWVVKSYNECVKSKLGVRFKNVSRLTHACIKTELYLSSNFLTQKKLIYSTRLSHQCSI